MVGIWWNETFFAHNLEQYYFAKILCSASVTLPARSICLSVCLPAIVSVSSSFPHLASPSVHRSFLFRISFHSRFLFRLPSRKNALQIARLSSNNTKKKFSNNNFSTLREKRVLFLKFIMASNQVHFGMIMFFFCSFLRGIRRIARTSRREMQSHDEKSAVAVCSSYV